MSFRKILAVALILITFAQLSFGFYYINSVELCPLRNDHMLITAIGGVFTVIFFIAAFTFVYSITPAKYKIKKKLSESGSTVKESNRIIQILVGI